QIWSTASATDAMAQPRKPVTGSVKSISTTLLDRPRNDQLRGRLMPRWRHRLGARLRGASAHDHGPAIPTLVDLSLRPRSRSRLILQLVLTRHPVWSGRRDSNPRPSPWQGD